MFCYADPAPGQLPWYQSLKADPAFNFDAPSEILLSATKEHRKFSITISKEMAASYERDAAA